MSILQFSMKKIIIISGVNLFQGGTLIILKDNLKYLNDYLANEFEIVALVHKKELFCPNEFNKINFIEFPKSRNSYFTRLYLEYFYFKKISKKLKPYLWFSLHDITPSVCADIRVVYCHNASPFKKVSISDLFFQPVLFLFTIFYKFLYSINLKENNFIVVQQNWIKKEFYNMFNLFENKILVCYPEYKKENLKIFDKSDKLIENSKIFTFFYPALARPFKNFEVIGEAIKLLEKNGIDNFRVLITIDGNENNYSKYIFNKYKNLKKIQFLGMLTFQEVNQYYNISDALLFTSTLETWGLPITEFKSFNKPIVLSKLPYAFETVGDYNKALFFNPLMANELADKIASLINGNVVFDETLPVKEDNLVGWAELYNKILAR